MNIKRKIKRILVLTLALVMALGITTPALAAYPLLPVNPPTTLPEQIPTNYIAAVVYPAASGTVLGGGYYQMGQQVYLQAIPYANYQFVGWYLGNDLVTNEPNFFFYAYGEDIYLVARFKEMTPVVPPTPPVVTPTPPIAVYPGVPPAGHNILVMIDGKYVQYEDAPFVAPGDRTMAPMRLTLEALGATVNWNEATQTVTTTRGDVTIRVTVGSSRAYVNNAPVTLDAPAQMINNRVFVPLRFMSEEFKFNVDWSMQDGKQLITVTQQIAIH